MNFSNKEEIKELLNSLPKITDQDNPIATGSNSYFQPIVIDDFKIFLSAGPGSLSTPHNRIFQNILKYSEVQVIIFGTSNGVERIINPGEDFRFQIFDWKKYFLRSSWTKSPLPSYIGIYIPIDDVIEIIRSVKRVSRIQAFI
jgi:hypothetical protein